MQIPPGKIDSNSVDILLSCKRFDTYLQTFYLILFDNFLRSWVI